MAVMDLEEQEQIAELKAWWGRYGNLICVVVLAVSVVVLGVMGWRFYQNHLAQQAVMPYEAMKQAVDAGDLNKVAASADVLAKEYPSTSLATMGNMEAARFFFEKGDLEGAAKRYRWVAENGVEPEWQMMARLNLAQVLIDKEQHDEALKALDAATPVEGFEARLLSVRGDVYWLSGRLEEARKAYQAALTQLDAMPKGAISATSVRQQDLAFRQIVEFKLSAVGGIAEPSVDQTASAGSETAPSETQGSTP